MKFIKRSTVPFDQKALAAKTMEDETGIPAEEHVHEMKLSEYNRGQSLLLILCIVFCIVIGAMALGYGIAVKDNITHKYGALLVAAVAAINKPSHTDI